MSRNHSYNHSMYQMLREQSIIKSRTLSLYFKDVFVQPYIRSQMDDAKRKIQKLEP